MSPGRPAPQFIRIEEHQGDWTLSFARALWRAIGEPEHVTLHRGYDVLHVVADTRAQGYVVTGGTSTPRMCLTAAEATACNLAPGHYHATTDDVGIVTHFERDPANGRRVYMVHQTAGQSGVWVWRIRTDTTRSGTIIWEVGGDLSRTAAMQAAQRWCEQRDYRLVKPPKWEW